MERATSNSVLTAMVAADDHTIQRIGCQILCLSCAYRTLHIYLHLILAYCIPDAMQVNAGRKLMVASRGRHYLLAGRNGDESNQKRNAISKLACTAVVRTFNRVTNNLRVIAVMVGFGS